MDWPSLIATLKQIMQEDKISANTLAEQLGVSISSVRNYLSLRQRASISTREKIEAFVAAHQSDSKKSTTTRRRGGRKAKQEAKPAAQTESKKQSASTTSKPAARTRKQTTAKNDNAESKQNTDAAAQTEPAKQTNTRRRGRPSKQQSNAASEQSAKQTDRKQNSRASRSNKTNSQQAATTTKQQNANTNGQQKQQPKQNKQQQTNIQAKPAAAAKQPEQKQQEPKQSAEQPQQDTTPIASRVKTPARKPATNSAVRIYVDESFGQGANKPFTVGMVLCSTEPGIMPFREFTNTLYPFGWAPGDEVKAQGKDLSNVKYVLKGSLNDDIRMVAFRTKMVPPLLTITDDDSTMVTIFPYVSGLINAIEQLQHSGLKGTQFQIIIDRTNKLPTESLRVIQNMLDVYFQLSTPQHLSFHITDGDSRAQKGLQLADFVAHYAYVEDPENTSDFAPVNTFIDDDLGNARRFAFYSGLRLVQLRAGARMVIADNAERAEEEANAASAAAAADEDADVVTPVDDASPKHDLSRAMELAMALRKTVISAGTAGLRGKELESVRSRLKGLSTTVANWLLDSQDGLLDGLANRTIADFRERLAIISRVDKPFKPAAEIGEQQFHIFETQLDKIQDLLESYSTTAEKD
ncbi:HTH domain-containing protein [Lacticaseibacillus zhaodongensis]|uniref:HTH domain-containing protein n=1 Tax=Lacticaseibacillus zhaodongensis TaxID=2668065 RepID=UPI0012D36A3C|nr:HTH domain-containing protein [Lacticaseibacillus zhaodongensis]